MDKASDQGGCPINPGPTDVGAPSGHLAFSQSASALDRDEGKFVGSATRFSPVVTTMDEIDGSSHLALGNHTLTTLDRPYRNPVLAPFF